jgi:hypothetical protein
MAARAAPPPVRWVATPACSPFATSRTPITLTAAPGTSVQFTIEAADADDGSFDGRLQSTGLPDDVTHDRHTGVLTWRPRGSGPPAETTFEAISKKGGRATLIVRFEVAETPQTRVLRLLAAHAALFRDIERAALPSDEDVRLSWNDGESAETHALRVEGELAEQEERREALEATYACNALPWQFGQWLDVDGDGVPDGSVSLRGGAPFVFLRRGDDWLPVGTLRGDPGPTTTDGTLLFVREHSAENTVELAFEWVDREGQWGVASFDHASTGGSHEFDLDDEGRLVGVILRDPDRSRRMIWSGRGFVIAPPTATAR